MEGTGLEQAARVRHLDAQQPVTRTEVYAGTSQERVARLRPRPSPPGTRSVTRRSDETVASISGPARTTGEFLIRLLDITGALTLLVLSLPVMIVSALLIKVSSAGPVFYRQQRVGKGGRLFTLCKFRTMVNDAEKHVGPVLATKDDARVTPVGRVLRRMHLDELPQICNVLRGDMSLVGPRPERPFFVEQHTALQGIRLAVKPGLTGLAQVRSYYDLKPNHKVKYDTLYIQKRSVFLNLYILVQTIPVLFAKKGW
jgi:lipopolysaccharide/colanic/teichoic acid biosynthesis glycosyltransferase